ncbi:MAG: hypothetical protein K2Y51_26490 [Gammaproteobacteria bacterium]|nr:hypothetical protein [Gammaproteobacteria bacterium]
MNTKIPHRAWRALAVASALTMSGSLQAAPGPNDGALRVVSTEVRSEGDATVVAARISRSLLTRVLTPRVLRIAIVDGQGNARAEQRRVVGPAQLARGNTRDAFVGARLPAVAGAAERVVVELL